MSYLSSVVGLVKPENSALHKVETSIAARFTPTVDTFLPQGTLLKAATGVLPIMAMADPAVLVASDMVTPDVVTGILAHDVNLKANEVATVGVVVQGVYYSQADAFAALTAPVATQMAGSGLKAYGVAVPKKY